uniref:G-protein coupled receptors family 1 profile domain-containing protein n=1 Tax=Romanomermis culicivorax TaxID=13658 RepID=A0A915JXY3_ROMCU
MDICLNRTCYRPYFGQNCLDGKLLVVFNFSVIGRFLNEGCTCDHLRNDNSIENWHCEEQFFDHSWYLQFFYVVLFTLIVTASIGGNAIVVWVVLAHKRMRNVTNYFLVNLSIADASISLLNVCFSFTTNFYYEWFFADFYCAFNHFMGVMPTCASVFTLMSLSLDRTRTFSKI